MSLQLKFYKICIHCQLSINALSSTDVKSFDVIPPKRSKCWIAIAPSGCSYLANESPCFSPSVSLFLPGTCVESILLLWQRFLSFASQFLLSRVMHASPDHHPRHSSVFGLFLCFLLQCLVGSTVPCPCVRFPLFPTSDVFHLCTNDHYICRGSCI